MRFLQTSSLALSPYSRTKGIFRVPPTADSLPSPAAMEYLSPIAISLLPRSRVPSQNSVSYWEMDILLPSAHDTGARKDQTKHLATYPNESAPTTQTKAPGCALQLARAAPCGKARFSIPDDALRWTRSDLSDKNHRLADRGQTKPFFHLLPWPPKAILALVHPAVRRDRHRTGRPPQKTQF